MRIAYAMGGNQTRLQQKVATGCVLEAMCIDVKAVCSERQYAEFQARVRRRFKTSRGRAAYTDTRDPTYVTFGDMLADTLSLAVIASNPPFTMAHVSGRREICDAVIGG